MKKVLLMALALGMGGAGAQRVEFSNGAYDLLGCYRVQDGVRCDFTYTAAKDGQMGFSRSWFEAVTTQGTNIAAEKIAAAGGRLLDTSYLGSISTFKNAPTRLSVLFPSTPSNSFAVLSIAGQAIRNVQIGGATPAAASPPAASTPSANLAGNWNAVLTNCKAGSNGTVVCTATLTPRR